MVQLILAFIGLALVYFVLLYGGIRLMAAFNLMPKEWFENARTEYLVLMIEPKVLRSGPETSVRLSPTEPSIRALAGPPAVSKLRLISAFHRRRQRWQMLNFIGYASQNDIRTSIKFHNAPQFPVTSYIALGQTATGELTWRN